MGARKLSSFMPAELTCTSTSLFRKIGGCRCGQVRRTFRNRRHSKEREMSSSVPKLSSASPRYSEPHQAIDEEPGGSWGESARSIEEIVRERVAEQMKEKTAEMEAELADCKLKCEELEKQLKLKMEEIEVVRRKLDEERLDMLETKRKLEEDRADIRKQREKLMKREQSVILGRAGTRPKLQFSLNKT
ncbi:unnamed protein product [Soboliphyme baturini]|uniref:BMERB domain-containing protein n=1 Tax=Soboliphyme baturini TaxID=241478 RepID=A0A183IH07_9BILA|nr:unnamed protein product [Soboliphyme baturini]